MRLRTLTLALSAACLLFSQAIAATLPATTTTLAAVEAKAVTGDVVQLAAGTYPSPHLIPKPGLTFEFLPGAVGVEWRLGAWQDVTFLRPSFRVIKPGLSGLEIGGDGITVDTPRVEGPGIVDGVSGEGYGLSFLGVAGNPAKGTADFITTSVKVTGKGIFDGLESGIRTNLVHGLVIEDQDFTRIRADGISLSGIKDFRLLRNRCHDFRPTGKHPDCVQANRPLLGIALTQNGFVQGNYAEGPIQGLFLVDTKNVVIEGNHTNVIAGIGIGVSGTTDVTLRGNTLDTWGGSVTHSQIDTRGAVNLKFEGVNVARAFGNNKEIVYPPTVAPVPVPPTPVPVDSAQVVALRAQLAASEASVRAIAAELTAAKAAAAADVGAARAAAVGLQVALDMAQAEAQRLRGVLGQIVALAQ